MGKKRKTSVCHREFGQHFMHNRRTIQEIIQLADLRRKDHVVEIGAGTGALTIPLAEKAGDVLTVEKDPLLAEKLSRKIQGQSNIRLIQTDFLQMNLPRKPFCVVANIPYSITTPILHKLLDRPAMPLQRAVLVIEKGAAIRFTGTPIRDPRTLTWRMWFDIKRERNIPPDHFSPPPRVDSSILLIRKKKHPGIAPSHRTRFLALARTGLRHPHAPLSQAFTGVFTPPQITRLSRNLGIDRDTPVQSLNERHWEFLFQTMLHYVPPFRWPKKTNRS